MYIATVKYSGTVVEQYREQYWSNLPAVFRVGAATLHVGQTFTFDLDNNGATITVERF